MYNIKMPRLKNKNYEYLVLGPTEALVVQALRKNKDGLSVSEISRSIRLARTSIYKVTAPLIKRAIIKKEKFRYILCNQLHEKSFKNNSPPDQIHSLLQELLRLEKGEIIYSIESNEEIRELFKAPEELLDWQKTIAERGIVLKGIGTENSLDIFRTLANAELTEWVKKRSGSARFTHQNIGAACTLVSFRNSVIFFSRKKGLFYRIDNSEVAKFVQSTTDLLFSHLEHHQIL